MAHRDATPSAQIDVWYGDVQRFGQRGHPQRWINVLGRVVPGDGSWPLCARLNQGPARTIPIGPNRTRLASGGDFNLEIDRDDLREGDNIVELEATGPGGRTVTREVTLHYETNGGSKLPHSVEWRSARAVGDLAAVVDGRWTLGPDGLHTAQVGYDRCFAIGDSSWRSYEVTARVTAHAIETHPLPYPSDLAGFGIVLRWRGHVDWSPPFWKLAARALLRPFFARWRYTLRRADEVPRRGWWPRGAAAWYSLTANAAPATYQFSLLGNDNLPIGSPRPHSIDAGGSVVIKARVEERQGAESYYAAKLWPADRDEPSRWDVEGHGIEGEPASGSVLLVAHHADVTFGDVVVVPLEADGL